MRFDELFKDPWFFFVFAVLAGLVITLIAGAFSMAVRLLCEIGLSVDRKLRAYYEDRHAVRRMRRAGRLVVVLCLVLAGSATATAAKRPGPWSHVRIAANVETVAQCMFVADVEASGRYVVISPSGTTHADRLALKRLRIRTHRAGGDVVLVTWFQAGNSRAFYEGKAYDCDKSE